MSKPVPLRTTPQPTGPIVMLLAAVLTLAGFLLTAYLSLQSLSESGGAAGCGSGSDCAEVLSSRWSSFGPVPVALLGMLTYLALLLGLGARFGSKGSSMLGDRLLWVGPPVLIVAGLWFMTLQVAVLDALCPYCMASHAIGLLLAGVLMFGVLRVTVINPKPVLFLGFLAGGTLIAGQIAMPPAEPPVQLAVNPFVDEDGDTVIDDKRYLSLFGGKLQFILEDVAYIGDPRAEQVVVVLFDYACPHCRSLHGMLEDAVRKDPERFVVVPLPVTIDERHNPYIQSAKATFDDSHERAALSLAVAQIDRNKWKTFDRWLFATDDPSVFPRPASDVRIKAEQLVGLPALNEQLTGESMTELENQIKRNIELLSLIPIEKRYIPVTTTPGAPSHLTQRFFDIAVLYELLDAARAAPEASSDAASPSTPGDETAP